MTVLDAYAVLDFLRSEDAAEEVEALLSRRPVLPAVNAIEVLDQLVRSYGRDADDVEADLVLLEHAGLRVQPLEPEAAIAAGRLRARHYHRERCSVSLADCVAAASALLEDRPLATADPALAGLVRAEGGKVIALPNTRGARP